jgi:hypothetical protein
MEDVRYSPISPLWEDEDFIQKEDSDAFTVRLKKHYDIPWIEYGPEEADISEDAEAVKFIEKLGFAREPKCR